MRIDQKLLLFLVILTNSVSAQDTTRTWLNSLKESTTKGAASYYRLSWEEDSVWKINDYYLNGSLETSGAFLSMDTQKKTGPFFLYYRDGSLSTKCTYKDNYLIGSFKTLYPEGHTSVKGTYAEGLTIGERREINRSGENDMDSLSVKQGIWTYYHHNGRVSAKKDYDLGILFSEIYWEEDGTDTPPQTIVDRMPDFPGGSDAMMSFLGKNISYPKEDLDKKNSGTVVCAYTIDRQGHVKDIRIIESVSPGLDAEAIRVINLMPRWIPGKQENRTVEIEYELPIKFSLKTGSPGKK